MSAITVAGLFNLAADTGSHHKSPRYSGPCESGEEHTAFSPRSITAMTGSRGICAFAGFSNHPATGIPDPKCRPARRP